jgi:hypothetical protein
MGNTGYKSFANLELYYVDNGSSTGQATKPNVVTDPDYIAPVLDTVTCAPSIRYYNVKKQLGTTKKNCSSGYKGNEVTLTANANQFVSTISVADANAQADAWLAENVQTNANNLGVCELITNTGGSGGCLVEGTLITLPDGTQMPIETLAINQLLLSTEIETLRDTNNALELYKWNSSSLLENRITSPIVKIERRIVSETIIINEGLLEATPSHSQLIQRDGIWKFIALGDVVVGDKLYDINKEIIAITSVIISSEKRNIYPLILSPSHTYFANGILTHNGKIGQQSQP